MDNIFMGARDGLAAEREGMRRNLGSIAILRGDEEGLWAAAPRENGWDHERYLAQSRMLESIFKDDLVAFARAGSGADLEEFMRSMPLTLDELNRLPALWLTEVFDAADPKVIPLMLKSWIEPAMERPSGRSSHCSGEWAACVGVAIARAGGDEGILGACEGLMRKALGEVGYGPNEKISNLLFFAIDRGRAGCGADFGRALRAGAALAQSRDASFLPVFASRLQDQFDSAYDAAVDDQARMAGWIECAREFLEWSAQIELSPPGMDYPPAVRALGLCLPFALRPELAEGVARLCARYAGPDGFRLSKLELGLSQSLGLPFHAQDEPNLFGSLGWAGRPVGPVDLALLLGSQEGARALRSAGVPWSASEFAALSVALEGRPGVRNDYVKAPYKLYSVGDACRRARAWAERLELEADALPARGHAPTLRM